MSYRVFIKYSILSKNSRKFATSPSPALGCNMLYKKWPANRCHWSSECGQPITSLPIDSKKTHHFYGTPCEHRCCTSSFNNRYSVSYLLCILLGAMQPLQFTCVCPPPFQCLADCSSEHLLCTTSTFFFILPYVYGGTYIAVWFKTEGRECIKQASIESAKFTFCWD